MAKGSYNSVGAGETPKLGNCSSIYGEAHDGGNQTLVGVKVSTDIPKVARPGGATALGQFGGSIPKAARPGGSQIITAKTIEGKAGIERGRS